MNTYKYTQTWFLGSEIRKILLRFVENNKVNKILEIGCFEGLSACFFSDNIMDHEQSTLDCVDPHFPTGTVKGITSKCIDQNTIKLFKENTSNSKNSSKITYHNETSDDFFSKNQKKYNFIYIDGCHEDDYIIRDMENSFRCLEKDGIMWMDDYRGNNNRGKISQVMDKVLEKYAGQYKLLYKRYQLAIQKNN